MSAIVSGNALCEGHMVTVKMELVEVRGAQLADVQVSDAEFLEVYHSEVNIKYFTVSDINLTMIRDMCGSSV